MFNKYIYNILLGLLIITSLASAGNPIILHSTDYGLTWESQSTDICTDLNAVFTATADGKAVAVGDNGGVVINPSGTVWLTHSRITTKNLNDVVGHWHNAEEFWVVGDDGTIFRSLDSGWNWTELESGTDVDLHSIFMGCGGLYAVGDDGIILLSTDNGNNWSTLSSNSNEDLFGVGAFNYARPNVAVGYNGTILKFDGYNWITQVSGTTSHLLDVAYWKTLPNEWNIVVGASGTILRSLNYSDWQSVPSGTPRNLYGVDNAAYGTAILVTVGSSGTIIRSDNEGASWTPITSNTNKILRDIDFTWLGEHGYIVGDTKADISIRSLSIEEVESVPLSLRSICSGNNIEVQLSNSGEYSIPVILTLYNISGRIVAEFGDYSIVPGNNSIHLSNSDIDNLSAGLYFLTATFTNGILVDRVMLYDNL